MVIKPNLYIIFMLSFTWHFLCLIFSLPWSNKWIPMCCNYVITVRYKRCFFILCLKRKNCSDIFLNILCTEQVVIYWAEAGVRAGAACRFRLQPEGWLRLQSMPIRCCLIKGFKNFFKWSIINHYIADKKSFLSFSGVSHEKRILFRGGHLHHTDRPAVPLS